VSSRSTFERLARREYGICRGCREVIGLARLKALPFAHGKDRHLCEPRALGCRPVERDLLGTGRQIRHDPLKLAGAVVELLAR